MVGLRVPLLKLRSNSLYSGLSVQNPLHLSSQLTWNLWSRLTWTVDLQWGTNTSWNPCKLLNSPCSLPHMFWARLTGSLSREVGFGWCEVGNDLRILRRPVYSNSHSFFTGCGTVNYVRKWIRIDCFKVLITFEN